MDTLKESLLLKGVFPVSDLFFHTSLGTWYGQIQKMLEWPPEKILEWQNDTLRRLIDDAYHYSPYYHNLFDSISLDPRDIKTKEDLNSIPPLTKDIIREHYDDILLHGKKGIHYRHASTGGSTGNPTRYVKDNNSWGFINAFHILMWKKTGYHYGDPFLALGSSSLFPTNQKSIKHSLYYGLKGKTPFNAMNMSEERMNECIDIIKKKNIHYIYGYASSIFLLAKFLEDQHRESEVSIRACFPTSEILTDVYRNTIERVFRCVVSDMYGAHDGGIAAHKISDGYKVGYNCLVQTLDGSSSGPALLTDVLSTSFPFIRYQLGDEVSLDEGYNSFYNGQVLSHVIGRTSDVIRLENGRVLTGPGFTILFSKLRIKGYRVFKSGKMEITVEVVPGEGFDREDDNLIKATMQKHAGEDCQIIINHRDAVETRKNGKNLFFLNDV